MSLAKLEGLGLKVELAPEGVRLSGLGHLTKGQAEKALDLARTWKTEIIRELNLEKMSSQLQDSHESLQHPSEIAADKLNRILKPSPTGKRFDGPDVVDMPLEHLAKSNIAIKIFSEVLGKEVWLLSDQAQCPSDRVSFLASELKTLIQLDLRPEEIRLIHSIKGEFKGAKIERVDRGPP